MIKETEVQKYSADRTNKYDQGMDSRNKIDMNIMDESSTEAMMDMNNTRIMIRWNRYDKNDNKLKISQDMTQH